jgi:hypothetical protein
MSEPAANAPGPGKSAGSGAQSIGYFRWLGESWARLFAPRDRILLEMYRQSLTPGAPGDDAPTTLDAAREAFNRANAARRSVPDVDRDREEAGVVFVTRAMAILSVLCGSLVPVGFAAIGFAGLWPSTGRDPRSRTALGFGFAFGGVLAGILLMAALSRPYLALVKWMARTLFDTKFVEDNQSEAHPPAPEP